MNDLNPGGYKDFLWEVSEGWTVSFEKRKGVVVEGVLRRGQKAQVPEITAGAGWQPCEDDAGRGAAAAGQGRDRVCRPRVRVTLQFKVWGGHGKGKTLGQREPPQNERAPLLRQGCWTGWVLPKALPSPGLDAEIQNPRLSSHHLQVGINSEPPNPRYLGDFVFRL